MTPEQNSPHWELLSRFRECATDWNGKQMPDLEPAKGDVTAGELRAAADLIERQAAEIAGLREAGRRHLAACEAKDNWCDSDMTKAFDLMLRECDLAAGQLRATLEALEDTNG